MARANQEFIPAMASRTPALRVLTHKSVYFKWEECYQKEFDSLIGSINLTYFDPKLNTHVIVDAHIDGLCAILAQGKGNSPTTKRAVAIASRATTNTEKRYPQLNLEALAVDFGLRRLRQYLIGNPKVRVHSDHKPLVSIFRNRRQGSVRIEHIKLRHQDVDYVLHHLQGINNPADYCSRSLIPWNKLPSNIINEADEPECLLYHFQSGGIRASLGHKAIKKDSNSCPEVSVCTCRLHSQGVKRETDRNSNPLLPCQG